jgi:hypothetical protein
MKYLIATSLSAFFLILFSCQSNTKPSVQDQKKKDTLMTQYDIPEPTRLEGTSYKGSLPNTNNEMIETELIISNDFQKAQLIEKQGSNTIYKDASLNTERGYEKDPDATVYILDWEKPENDQRYFVRSTGKDGEVFEIDPDRKKFTDGKNHTLLLTK